MKQDTVRDLRGREFPQFLARTALALRAERSLTGSLAQAFHTQLIRRDAQAIGFGPQAVTTDLRAQLVAMPDQQAQSEDVIWSGNPQLGMLGAQRLILRGTHLGPGPWGPATGRALSYREMSETYAKAGRISDVWTLRDSGAICAQLGLDPAAQGRAQLAACDPETGPFRPAIDQQGAYTGLGNDNQWGLAFADLLTRIMAGELQIIPGQYDEACQTDHPGGQVSHGQDAASAFWLGLRAAFPDAQFTLHHRIGMEDPLMPPRAALRWSLSGRHSGWGAFGAPTGAPVYIMGMSHAEFGPGGLRREWTLYDAVAIWMQIAAHKG